MAAVFLNGNNIALFNNEPTQPLSIISENLNVGNFVDNTGDTLPIEYDGISSSLTIYGTIQPGATNTLRIAIADTGDDILDSGLFISNLQGTQLTGSGISGVTYGTAVLTTFRGQIISKPSIRVTAMTLLTRVQAMILYLPVGEMTLLPAAAGTIKLMVVRVSIRSFMRPLPKRQRMSKYLIMILFILARTATFCLTSSKLNFRTGHTTRKTC